MCPDRELLSAWVDGEIPSPWSDSIDRHVGACSSMCTAVVAAMETQTLFSSDRASMDEASLVAKSKNPESPGIDTPHRAVYTLQPEQIRIESALVA
ncbi:hypothetical protein MASR2M48_30350 [Spirochaetota bacterium]